MAPEPLDDHISSVLLDELLAGRSASGQVLPRALEHLSRRCPRCLAVLEQYPRPFSSVPAGSAYTDARRRACRRLRNLAGERDDADSRIAELLEGRMVAEALAWASVSPRFHTWGLASVLTERSEDALEDRPREAQVWAQLAVAVAARLDPKTYGDRLVAEARGLAGVRFACALLEVQGDPAGAEHELGLAAAWAPAAVDPPAMEIEVELARCRLDLAAGRFEEVRARAEAIEKGTPGGRFAGLRLEALLVLGRALRGAGELSLALAAFQVLQAVLGRYGELPAMERRSRLEIGQCLCRLGRPAEALKVLRAIDFGEEEDAGRAVSRRAFWAGVCLRNLGRSDDAEAALEAAWRGLAEEGAAVESERALLELAAVYLEADRAPVAAALFEEADDLYRVEGLPRPAALVLLGLQEAAARGQLDLAAIETACARLEPIRQEPPRRSPVH